MTARVETMPVTKADERAVVRPGRQHSDAPLVLRCGAFLIDYIITVATLAINTLVPRLLWEDARSSAAALELIGLIITFTVILLNQIVLVGFSGTTIGKFATGLRIVRVDGAPLNIGHSLLRHFVGYPLSILTFGVGFIIGVFNRSGRTLHDFVSGTVVVRDQR